MKGHKIIIVTNEEEIEVELNSMLFETLKEVITSAVRKSDLRVKDQNEFTSEEMNLLIKREG